MRTLTILMAAGLIAMSVSGTPTIAEDEEQDPLRLSLNCNNQNADVQSMEHEYLEKGCWGHLGMHTYFLGRDTVYDLQAGEGRVFSVEQQLSPPLEDPRLQTDPPQLFTPLPIETSLDGIEWTRVSEVDYKFIGLESGGTSSRQEIFFEFEADGQPFQYLRVRQPLSAAQGLSGYLDASRLAINVTESDESPPALSQASTRTCEKDIMEAVWDAHPCWFGGINRWDTPSFIHTYPLGDATLDRVEGTATFAYWRPEDPGTFAARAWAGPCRARPFCNPARTGPNGRPSPPSPRITGHR